MQRFFSFFSMFLTVFKKLLKTTKVKTFRFGFCIKCKFVRCNIIFLCFWLFHRGILSRFFAIFSNAAFSIRET